MKGRLRRPGAILLISCYELGHAPMGLASPLGFLARAGLSAEALDIAVDALDPEAISAASFIGISVPMHTALRLGLALIARIRAQNLHCHVCFYGLYASLNAERIFARGGDAVIGGEYESPLLALIEALDAGLPTSAIEGLSRPGALGSPLLRRLPFALPRREKLPAIERYAQIEGGGLSGPAGYVEATRGCLHRCRHCPITPVYDGRFFAVPIDLLLADIRQQVEAGITHLTFGDPDFLNGPSHALRVARALHAEHPKLSFDCTAKVEHILAHAALFPELRALGCVFIVSAFESTSDEVLTHLDKGHVGDDEIRALGVLRNAGISLRPTWVPFTPWTTLKDYADMLAFIEGEGLIDAVTPVQYGLRLLVPPGSALLNLPAMQPSLGPLDAEALSHRWTHPDPRMDALQIRVAAEVARATANEEDEFTTFVTIQALVAEAQGLPARSPRRREKRGASPPHLSEAWFC
ncbi:MAG: CUAEP/CCAEP-tail radical SAM protein [Minicystis sp.]